MSLDKQLSEINAHKLFPKEYSGCTFHTKIPTYNIPHPATKKKKIEIKVDQEDYMVTCTFLERTSKSILSSNGFLQLSNEQIVPSLLFDVFGGLI